MDAPNPWDSDPTVATAPAPQTTAPQADAPWTQDSPVAASPAPQAAAPTPSPAPAPTPAPAQDQPQTIERPKPTDAPIIISGIKPQGREVDNRATEAGFDLSEPQYHSALTAADKAEYANFFKNRNNPPSAAALGLWYHQKTGAYLANAQQIVDAFKATGKFQTNEEIHVPTVHQSAPAAAINHVANAVAGDYGPEVAATLSAVPDVVAHAVGLGNGNVGTNWDNNADTARAQLEQDSADHPIASTAGELAGAGLIAPVAGSVADIPELADVPGAVRTGAGAGVYGSGAAGPGNRLQGAAEGFALGSATDAVAPRIIAMAERRAAANAEAQSAALAPVAKAAQAAQDLGITLPKFALSDSDRAAAGALEQTPFGRGPIVAARNALIDTSQAAKSGIANDLGTAPETAAQLGDQTLDAAVKSNKARRDNIGTLYDYANSMASGTQVQPTATLDTLNSLLSDESQKIGGSKLAPVLQSFRDDIAQRGTITVDQARSLRTDLRDTLTNDAGSTPSNADRITNQVMVSVNADMKSSLPADAFDTYKQADTAWAQQRSLEDDVLKPFLGRDFDNWGDQVAQKINSDAKGNGVRLARFLSSLPDQDANNVRASIIQGLGKSRDGSQNAEGDAFSLGTFLTNWNQLSGSRKLIFPPDTVQALDKLAQVADVAKRAENMRNNSKTGGVVSRLLMTGETSGSMVGFMTGHPHEAAVGLLLAGLTGARQYGAAKLLANPAFAKKLAATPLNPKAVQAFWSRPWVKGLQLQNPAIAGEIQAFAHIVANDPGVHLPLAARQGPQDQQANSAQP